MIRILFAAGEAVPFVKTGGLADVAGSLPRALHSRYMECRVVIPLYADISQDLRRDMTFLTSFDVPVAWRHQYCGVFEAHAGGVTYYLLDNEYYFKRAGIYGHYDDAERFVFFSRAVLEMIRHIDFRPDVVHANDWHTALIPLFYEAFYGEDPAYTGIKTVFTVHNVQYQGHYGRELLEDMLGLPPEFWPAVEMGDGVNFLKSALVTADAVTTVSPGYAEELKIPYYAYGLDALFRGCGERLSGILNGIDTRSYDPARDPSLSAPFRAGDIDGKRQDKRALQQELGLPESEGTMLVGMVSRLVENKGLDLVAYALDELLTDRVQVAVLGTGDLKYETFFREKARRYPGRLAAVIGFREDLARRIYAGSDVLLMPSRTEPCGLAQMVAMRYGTVPVVHATGGLADSVKDNGGDDGNGYTFKTFNAGDMLGALRRAEGAFAQPELWQGLVDRAMAADFSWRASAARYRTLYQTLVGRKS